MDGSHKVLRRRNLGFTLVETAIVIVVFGLMAQGFLLGQQLIASARVRNVLLQQLAVEAAFGGFQDRFRAPPGDYAAASTSIDCGAVPCLNGNGNGRIEPGPALREDILAWHHLTAAGFIAGNFSMQDAAVSSPDRDNNPVNIFGAYLQISADRAWGYSGNTSARHNAKTGNLVPAGILAEIDRKIDDGLPSSGRFQFSSYAGSGTAPIPGAAGGCTTVDSPNAAWRITDGSENCGATTLLY
jgi:hypothetical protein